MPQSQTNFGSSSRASVVGRRDYRAPGPSSTPAPTRSSPMETLESPDVRLDQPMSPNPPGDYPMSPDLWDRSPIEDIIERSRCSCWWSWFVPPSPRCPGLGFGSLHGVPACEATVWRGWPILPPCTIGHPRSSRVNLSQEGPKNGPEPSQTGWKAKGTIQRRPVCPLPGPSLGLGGLRGLVGIPRELDPVDYRGGVDVRGLPRVPKPMVHVGHVPRGGSEERQMSRGWGFGGNGLSFSP